MPLHVSSTCARRQKVKIVLYSLWYHHTCRWPSRAQVERGQSSLNLCTGLTPFCFLGAEITPHFSVVAGTGSAVRYCSLEQLGDRSMEITSGYRHT